jgi:sugar lactone lactonase YvrE
MRRAFGGPLIAATLMASLLRIAIAAAIFCVLAPAQDFSKITFEMVGKNFVFTEGPVWTRDGALIFSDPSADKIWKWTPGSDAVSFRAPANGASGNAVDSQGRLYTCETHARRVTRTNLKDGRIEVVADQWDGRKLNAPCDLAVSKSDHVYFTDPAFGQQQDRRELDFYGVYHMPPKGPLKLVAKAAGRPHGIAISPNGRVLYVTNADERNVRAYDLDHNGDASGERVLVARTDGIPGGLKVSEKGELYVATAKGIAIYSAQGAPIHTIPMRDRPSNCAFDPQGTWLYVTARGFLYRIRLDGKVSN